jgi:hypothetical protein
MRIPLTRLYDVFLRNDSPVVVADKEECSPFMPYFSSREGALLSRMVLCGFSFQDKIIGVLLIAESRYLQLEDKVLRMVFTVLEELTSALLFASRDERMHRVRETSTMQRDTFIQNIVELHTKYSSEISIFSLNTLPLIVKIREQGSDLDEYRIFQDITAVASTILDGLPIFPVPEKKRIVFAVDPSGPDSDLLIHQLSLSMKNFFHELGEMPDLEIRRGSYSKDGETPDAVTESLLR